MFRLRHGFPLKPLVVVQLKEDSPDAEDEHNGSEDHVIGSEMSVSETEHKWRDEHPNAYEQLEYHP